MTAAEGTIRAVTGGATLKLEEGGAWVVQSGRVDVFAIPCENGVQTGRRVYLFRAGPGELLLGAPALPGIALLGVGSPGTAVTTLDLEVLLAPATCAQRPREIAKVLDGWIGHVYQGLAIDQRIPRHRLLTLAATVDLDPGVCVRAAEPVGWLQFVTGSAYLIGSAAAPITSESVLPIAGSAWARTVECSTARLVASERLLEQDPAMVRPALQQLHRCALALLEIRLQHIAVAHRERGRRQSSAKQATMVSAMQRLAMTMEPARNGERPLVRLRPPGADESEESSLYAAFRLVTQAQGIEVGAGRTDGDQGSSKDPINVLARASRLRSRRVMLRGEWWREDGDPLLARLAERKRAVALLPVTGGYTLVDPYTRTESRVDESVIGTLGPFAYTFYRPFGTEVLGAVQLLKFGLRGGHRDLATVGMTGAVMALLGLVTPIVTGVLFTTVIPGADRGQLFQLILGLLVTAGAGALFQVVRGIALLRLESRAGPRLQAAVWDRLLTLPLSFFREYSAGDLAMRAMGIEEMRTIASGSVVTLLLSGVFSLAYVGLLFYYNWRLALVAGSLILLAVIFSLAISILQLRSQRKMVRIRSRTAGLVLQLLGGIPKLRVAGAEIHGFGRWARLFSEQREQQFRGRTFRNVQGVFTALYPLLSTLALFAAFGELAPTSGADRPVMSTGEFVAFLAAFGGALAATLSSSTALVGSLAVVPLFEELKPILQATPEVHGGRHDPGELTGGIELQHVNFRYRADGPAVLRDVSIRVGPGEFVALVGPSGSGKSTVLRLLLGFEVAESGVVTYDNRDLEGLDLEIVRRQIGVVLQSGRVMSGDIYTNIVGSSNATVDEAWEAARMAGLEEDIREMPMGMHTVISDGGSTLSGGQRQRLMIARALVRRPRILFFDEATSALDNRTQDIVSRSLDLLKVTRVVVAHRLSTIRNADRIYVIDAGRVVEVGSFGDLYARGGMFTQLVSRQLA